tara:strand:+ start:2245 stop:2475 length:231 start_codon:yes stop_codon:yes gene_type:complete
MYFENQLKKTENFFVGAIGFAILLGIGSFAASSVAKIPDVHISNSTGECVKVINYDERFDYNCENYPSKYNHIWVK